MSLKTVKNKRTSTLQALKDSVDVVLTVNQMKALSYIQPDQIYFCKANESFYRYEPTALNAITPDDLYIIAVTSDVNARWKAVAGKYSYESSYYDFIGFKETPSGLVNGSNTSYALSSTPISGTIIVFIDGTALKASDFSYSDPNVVLTTPPAFGQSIEVYYLINNGRTVFVNTTNYNFLYHQVTAGEIISKNFTLLVAPAIPANTIVDVVGGVPQRYGADFSITGTTFNWNGLGLDGLLIAGMYLRISYFS